MEEYKGDQRSIRNKGKRTLISLYIRKGQIKAATTKDFSLFFKEALIIVMPATYSFITKKTHVLNHLQTYYEKTHMFSDMFLSK